MSAQQPEQSAPGDHRATARQLLERRIRAAREGASAGSAPARIARGRSAEPVASFAQERMWLVDHLLDGAPGYAVPTVLRLRGPLDADAFQQSLTEVVRRHLALRTVFEERDGRPHPVVLPAQTVPLPIVDLRELPSAQRERRAAELAREAARTRFDLSAGPLLRASLLRIEDEHHLLVLVVHHIATDGWSMALLWKELGNGYRSLLHGRPPEHPDLPVRYEDYAHWQRERSAHGELDGQLRFWEERLADLVPLELPTDRPRPARRTGRGGSVEFALDAELATGLRTLAERCGATMFMTLLAGFQAVLARYTGRHDVAVGTPIAGRDREEVEDLIGFFANTLVLRTDLSGDPSFADLLGRVRQVTVEAYGHQEVPFDRLVERLRPERSPNRNPLVQVMFAAAEDETATLDLPGIDAEPVDVDFQVSLFDLTVFVTDTGLQVTGSVTFDRDLFDRDTAQRLIGHYLRFLAQVAADPGRPVSDVGLLDPAEREQVLARWNDTARELPSASLPDLFTAQVLRTPDAVAVECAGTCWTYAELDARADRLAGRLAAAGVRMESAVGLLLERSADLVVAVLAVLKAGGTYVPLNGRFPAERLRGLLEQVDAALLITDCASSAHPVVGACPVPVIDVAAAGAPGGPTAPRTPCPPEQAAYVMFTSGTTGVPKGIVVTHANVAALALDSEWGPAHRTVLAHSPHSFDAFTYEMWVPLLSGGRVVLAPPGHLDTAALQRLVREHRITSVFLTTALFNLVVEERVEILAGLQEVWTGGEAASLTAFRRAVETCPDTVVTHVYGPTETTTFATRWKADTASLADGRVPIGSPMDNTRLYVLGAGLEPVPLGAVGELCVAGAGVARGYLGSGAATAQRFLPDPFGPPGTRMYRTGDLVRRRADGNVEFVGRVDGQVKIRGFRIELGEIEAVLVRCPEVSQAVVVVHEDGDGDRRLVAYVVGAVGATVDPGVVRGELAVALPDYMVPGALVVLDVLPLTPNGKLDRRALPAPPVAESNVVHQPPVTATEELVAEIWSAVLGTDRIGRLDNFFTLGGHSLKATRAISRLNTRADTDVPLRTLFENPTLSGFAAALDGGRATGATTIARRAADTPAPLSYGQQRLWFLDRLRPGRADYTIPVVTRLRGGLDDRALLHALTEVVRRHEVLRSRYEHDGDLPVQIVEPVTAFVPVVTDLSDLPEGEARARAHELATTDAATPFDLSEAPLIRARLIRVTEHEHILALVLHHTVADGWSIPVLWDELAAGYAAAARGTRLQLPELPLQYGDIASWQRDRMAAGALADQLDHWRHRLADVPPLGLPADRPRPPVRSGAGDVVSFRLPAELHTGLVALGQREGATLFMTLLAGFQAVLARYTGRHDIAVGTPIAGRNRAELESLIGFFVNTLVLRTDLSGDPAFTELLARSRDTALTAYAHQDLPFDTLVEELQPDRDPSRNPLFDVLFQLHPDLPDALRIDGLAVEQLEVDNGTSKFDLSLALTERPDGLTATIHYATDLFDRATVERLAEHYVRLLTSAASDPTRPLSQLELLSPAERHQVLDAPTTTADFPRDRLLHELVEDQVRRRPHAIAVTCGTRQLTYAELNARANRLARYLRARGVGPGHTVAVVLDATREAVVAVLAVLKAGGAYVPVDPGYPADRLALILADSRARLALTQDSGTATPAGLSGVPVLDLARERSRIAAQSGENLPPAASSADLAYAIYTSGSTGRPKGVAVPHRGVVNYLTYLTRTFEIDEHDVVLARTALTFDPSVRDLFAPLSVGARVVVMPPDEAKDPHALLAAIEEQQVTAVLSIVPSMLDVLGATAVRPPGSALRLVMTTGEALTPAHARRARRLGAEFVLVNQYGPTECTNTSAFRSVTDRDVEDGRIPIGQPIPNARCYVLGEHLEVLPPGAVGELCIAGPGVTRGYLHDPRRTAEHYVPDPFGPPGERMYRTGDLARWRADGTLEFHGRRDNQVKVRGHRIELGELEAVLARHPDVAQAVAAARGEGLERTLVSYVVWRSPDGRQPSPEDRRSALLDFLRATLPAAMVPSAVVELGALPLTPNGKVDRKALPAPDIEQQRRAYRAPADAVERTIASVWEEVLGRERVGTHDDFFELGGHSLRATQVAARLRHRLGREIPLQMVFTYPTITAFARALDDTARAGGAIGHRETDTAPVSFGQQRLWLLDQLQPGRPDYNMPSAVRFRGPLDQDAVIAALHAVVARHDVLRSSFVNRGPSLGGGGLCQVVAPVNAFAPACTDLSHLPHAQAQRRAGELAEQDAKAPFDLCTAPLIRARLIRLATEDHLLVVVVHHAVFDGWSARLLWDEVFAHYRDLTAGHRPAPPHLAVTYRDFASWQRGRMTGAAPEGDLAYWRDRLTGLAPLELPTDRPRPPAPSGRGDHVDFTLPGPVLDRLRDIGKENGATLFMVLLAGFQTLLGRWAGTDDVAVGAPIAGRDHAELEPLIGFFVNTLVLRGDLSGDPTFTELVARARDTALAAYAHQDVPFERLVEAVRPERDLSRNPLFQVMLVLNDDTASPVELPGLDAEPVELGGGAAKFDLSLYLSEEPGGLGGRAVYATDLFDRATILRLIRSFERVLTCAAADPGRAVAELPLLDPTERHRVTVGRNRTSRALPRSTRLHELIADRCERSPHAVAVSDARQSLTYDALGRCANQLAHHLRSMGVGPDIRVGVCLERSIDLPLCLLAVLKAGGAYVPIDPDHPRERNAFMVGDSAVRVVLTSGAARDRVPAAEGVRVVDVAAERASISKQPETTPVLGLGADHLAYVIYTSGSTGVPKGVMVPHRGLENFALDMAERLELTTADTVAALTTASFDISVLELLVPLTRGATVHVVDRDTARDGSLLTERLDDAGVTVVQATPATWYLLTEAGWKGGPGVRALTGGEALPPALARRLRERVGPVWNVYGPTETTIWSTAHPLHGTPDAGPDVGAVPIGHPLTNTRVYVLDERMQPVPVGVEGELYIGGEGVVRGYAGRPGLTARCFVPDPFGTGTRLYATGDLVRWRADGALEYRGRGDDQVKIRGHRIELGEIEAALAHCEGVAEAAAAVHGEGVDAVLVGYVVRDPGHLEPVQPTEALHERLPGYMVPTRFVDLEELPLTVNGKLDRKALPAPDLPGNRGPRQAPRDRTELRMARIWEHVLGVTPVGVRDDFFALGGHSLKAFALIEAIRREMDVALPLHVVFRKPTVELMCEALPAGAGDRLLVPLADGDPAQPPLFLVHPQGGDVCCYLELARGLGSRRKVYGIESVGYNTDEPPLHQVPDMVDRYLSELRSAAPHGPYLLAGWSFGGRVAFEIAARLEAEGEQVAFLGLIDTRAPARGPVRPQEENISGATGLLQLGIAAGLDAEDLRGLDEEEAIATLLRKGHEDGRLPHRAETAAMRRMVRVAAANERAAALHRVTGQVRTDLHVFAVAEQHPVLRTPLIDPEEWTVRTEGSVHTIGIPGNHQTLVDPPHAAELAALMATALEGP
ncbi:amino acid adenylation domain-containing protein [Streptomyces sp. x-19]|uniref:non-ribosomal peptide synthetase n=1 Tax=Streptomyces sp. x-19 TaxID=2789280 RepID=UPI0039807E19